METHSESASLASGAASPTAITAQSIASNPGAKLEPIYTIRRPMHWAISEGDLKSTGVLTIVAALCFSIGSFFLGCVANIIVSYGGSAALTEIAKFMLGSGVKYLTGVALLFYVCGAASSIGRWSIIKQMKRECSPPKETIWETLGDLVREFLKLRLRRIQESQKRVAE